MIIGIAGLGLIGGSIAKAVKKYTQHKIFGYDISNETIFSASTNGTIDGELNGINIAQCDIIIAALYPAGALKYIETIAAHAKKGAVITDVCGVKRNICRQAGKTAAENGLFFIGGHPMAGTERNGYRFSNAELFNGASMLLTPAEETPDNKIKELADFYTSLGFARIVITTPEEHDSMIAYTSQLAHITSCSYVDNPKALKHKGFSAGSYQDMTRVARINADMWTELFLDNRDNLVQDLDRLISNLTRFRSALSDEDAEELGLLMNRSNDIKSLAEGGVSNEKING